MINENKVQRYQRQLLFPEWGKDGQRKMGRAKVAQVGCGALGSTLASCLVRAGVGEYTIIDKDRAELSNLHRQFLFDEADVAKGRFKARAAAAKLRRANTEVKITAVARELDADNAGKLLAGHDLVLDALDNMPARLIVNDWCVTNRVPWIYAGVAGACGMIMVIEPGRGPCLRCLFPDAVPADCADTATHGIIASAPAAIAALQATEAFKLILGDKHLIRGLRVFDLWTGQVQTMPIQKRPECLGCGKA